MVDKEFLVRIMVDETYERVDYDNPKEGAIHNWWNYIPSGLQDVWNDLGEEAKIAAAIVAANQAGKEEWD